MRRTLIFVRQSSTDTSQTTLFFGKMWVFVEMKNDNYQMGLNTFNGIPVISLSDISDSGQKNLRFRTKYHLFSYGITLEHGIEYLSKHYSSPNHQNSANSNPIFVVPKLVTFLCPHTGRNSPTSFDRNCQVLPDNVMKESE